MNTPDLKEVSIKESRIMEYIMQNDYDAVVIGRQDNFSWLTCGGRNCVAKTSENGVCMVVITKGEKFMIANSMDAQRIADEEMAGMQYTPVSLKWYEISVLDKVLEFTKGMRVMSDIPIPGSDFKPGEFYSLQYPLTSYEIERYRWLGRKAEEILHRVAVAIKPGMTEKEVEAMLISEYAKYDIDEVVGIIGSDERISRYRHCIATDKKIEKLVMLAPAVKKWGLTLPVTRMIYFGDVLPPDLEKKFDALCVIESNTMANCVPGQKFTNILDIQKDLYEKTSFPDEWRHHFQGGITGYVINDPTKCLDPAATIKEYQTFNWYITITGAKVEETIITSLKETEILSSNGIWPVKSYEAGEQEWRLPQIMLA